MKKHLAKLVTALFFLTAGLLIASPVTAEAKTGNKKLNVNQTYTQYDITGDKKADTLLISADRDRTTAYYTNYSVYINGKKVLSKQGGIYFSFNIRRLELKNGKVYLSIIPTTNNGDIPTAAIYQYKSGKLKKVIDLDAMSSIGNHNHVKKLKVFGNTISITYEEMSYALGAISFRLDYQYKNRKMLQKNTKARLIDTQIKYDKKTYWTASYSMKVLKKPNGKKIATLKKGQEAKIDYIYLNKKHNKIYLHIKIKGGKSGWVKGWTRNSKHPATTMFEEVQYAG